jgi:tetratricopeptide (TPR) repeat protein
LRPLTLRQRGLAAIFVAAASCSGLLGCAGHESRVASALNALDRGAPEEAVAALDQELGVATRDELPALVGDNALLLLDRGTVLQSLDEWKASARDLEAADKAIDILDLSRGASADLGKYLFSDSAGPYKGPAYEKLMINTVNLVNYLALADTTGAKVEARRLAVMQKYVRDNEEEQGLLGLGSYLAGFAFEKGGDHDEALNHYDDALRHAQYGSLRDPLRALTQGKKRSNGIDALIGDAGPLAPVEETGEAELLIVIGFGRVPQKIPKRIPIGLALTLVAHDISPGDRDQANALAARGAVTWVNFPTLGPSKGSYAVPTFDLDGKAQKLEQALDVEAEVRAAWEKKEPTIILSAITRMVTRVAASAITEGATKAAGGKDSGVAALGLLLGLASSITLTALDTPDTRGWSTLPARLAVARLRVPAGEHVITLGARGEQKRVKVTLEKGGWALVPLMTLH